MSAYALGHVKPLYI